MILRRDKGRGIDIPEFTAMGLKLYRPDAFIAIDWESRTVYYDFGSDE